MTKIELEIPAELLKGSSVGKETSQSMMQFIVRIERNMSTKINGLCYEN